MPGMIAIIIMLFALFATPAVLGNQRVEGSSPSAPTTIKSMA
jgi:hypothetical protein